MKNYNFFAMLSRMKYINRWGLMRSTIDENIAAHCLETAYIAHALAVINNIYFNGDISPERVAVYAMYHDTPEIITGDLPTPVKYFAPEVKKAYDMVEEAAIEKLISSLPVEMQDIYYKLLKEDEIDKDYKIIVKAADKISAYIKCIEEKRMGNQDYLQAEESTLKNIKDLGCKEADYFMENFIESYNLTIDEQA